MKRGSWLSYDSAVDPDHPFLPVMDAIALIKTDLDELMASRQKTEARLRESEEKYRRILAEINDAFFEMDLEGNLTFFNQALCRLIGYDEEHIAGLNYRAYVNPDHISQTVAIFKQVLTTGLPAKNVSYLLNRSDGQSLHVETSISLIKNSKNEPAGFRGIVRDVSHRKRIEKELIRHRDHLKELVNDQTRRLARSKTALQTILDSMPYSVMIIGKESHHLMGVISTVLDYSKIEAGKLELDETPFDLRLLIEDVAHSIAMRARNSGLEFASHIAPDVPSHLIGDPGRLRQVLNNLAGNALKFTKHGGIIIRAKTTAVGSSGVTLHFEVSDTGIGIPKYRQAAIFESFTQADGSTTPRQAA